jgi:phosphopantothenoylcysteine synthetase/decarboxylase
MIKQKSFLITAGSPKEVIDGVRYYANASGIQGVSVAKALAQQGNPVVVVMPDEDARLYESCDNLTVITKRPDGKKIVSAEDIAIA